LSSRKSKKKAPTRVRRANSSENVKRLSAEKEVPRFNLDDEEYVGLSSEMRAIMVELQSALDNDDEKGVARTCSKILKIMGERGEDAVPVVVRENAVEALGLSLPHSLPELMGFMGDGNADVREAVSDELDEMFSDDSLGDKGLAPIVTTLAQIVTEDDTLDMMITAIEDDMRPSVMVETYIKAYKTGTEEMKQKVMESVNDLLERDDDAPPLDERQMEDALNKYLAENPDDPDDDDLYGADKDDDGD